MVKLKNKKSDIFIMADGGHLDLMIAELLPRLWTSTSLIFHVQGPIDQIQVRNSPNTCLRTGLQAKDRIKIPRYILNKHRAGSRGRVCGGGAGPRGWPQRGPCDKVAKPQWPQNLLEKLK